MLRNTCHHVQDSAKCCIAGLLELHNRDVETAGALQNALADRGLAEFAIEVPGPLTPDFLVAYKHLGFWLLTGPAGDGQGTNVMLGDQFYHRPFPQGIKVDEPGPWLVTVFVPLNPMMVRRHTRPIV